MSRDQETVDSCLVWMRNNGYRPVEEPQKGDLMWSCGGRDIIGHRSMYEWQKSWGDDTAIYARPMDSAVKKNLKKTREWMLDNGYRELRPDETVQEGDRGWQIEDGYPGSPGKKRSMWRVLRAGESAHAERMARDNWTTVYARNTNEEPIGEETMTQGKQPSLLIEGLKAGSLARGTDELYEIGIKPLIEKGILPAAVAEHGPARDLITIGLLHMSHNELEHLGVAPKIKSIIATALIGKTTIAAYNHSGTLAGMLKNALTGVAAVSKDPEVTEEVVRIGQKVSERSM